MGGLVMFGPALDFRTADSLLHFKVKYLNVVQFEHKMIHGSIETVVNSVVL